MFQMVTEYKSNIILYDRGLVFHCTASELNKIYVLGGYDKNLKCCSGFWSLNY